MAFESPVSYRSILFLILFYPGASFAQWSVGTSFSGGVFLTDVVTSSHKKWESHTLSNTSPYRYGVGLKIGRTFFSRLNVSINPSIVQSTSRVENQTCLLCGFCFCPDFIEVRRSLFTSPLKIHYFFQKGKKWRPYVSIGFIPYYIFEEEVRYFEPEPSPQGGFDVSELRGVPEIGEPYGYHENTKPKHRFRAKNFMMGGGMNYRVSEDWSVQVELKAFFDRTYIETSWNVHGILGLDVLYRFGSRAEQDLEDDPTK